MSKLYPPTKITITNPVKTLIYPIKGQGTKFKLNTSAKAKISSKFNTLRSVTRNRRLDSLEHSRSICSWLESEIGRAKK